MIASSKTVGLALGLTLCLAVSNMADARRHHVPKNPQATTNPHPTPTPKVVEIEPVSGKVICWEAANGELVIPDGQNQCISRDRQWTKMR